MPDVLVADDNALSLHFLLDALAQLGLSADGVASGAATLAQAGIASYALLLLDRRMPGLSGEETLRRLRQSGVHTVAIATSAEVGARDREELHTAGFVAVLEKPFDLATLHAALQPYFGDALASIATPWRSTQTYDAVPILDDNAALPGVGGERSILAALRRLLVGELEQLALDLGEIAAGRSEESTTALGDRLHRLQASAGFCGAQLLSAACSELRRQLPSAVSIPLNGLSPLREAIDTTLTALHNDVS